MLPTSLRLAVLILVSAAVAATSARSANAEVVSLRKRQLRFARQLQSDETASTEVTDDSKSDDDVSLTSLGLRPQPLPCPSLTHTLSLLSVEGSHR